MTSPYSSNLLQQPATRRDPQPVPRPLAGSGGVTRVVAAPQAPTPMQVPQQQSQPVWLPQPQEAPAGSRLVPLLLAVIVVLVGAAALVAGYYATTQAAPSDAEQVLEEQLAAQAGFRDARSSAVDQGRTDVLENADTTSRLRASAAAQAAYDRAFARGRAAGQKAYRRPSSGGYRAGYSAPRIASPSRSDVVGAFGTAQALANSTGAPVDVEIYGQ